MHEFTEFQKFKSSVDHRNDEKCRDSQGENKCGNRIRGLVVTSSEKEVIDGLIRDLEDECQLLEPARSNLMDGKWIVDYTTAPPPSNGKLGPFVGIARQIINLKMGTYVNYLSVPGDLKMEWLSAKLEATFQEWDGVPLGDETEESCNDFLDDFDAIENAASSSKWFDVLSFLFEVPQNSNTKKIDYGAKCWKVNFKTLEIRLFGIPVLKNFFEKGTSRVWKMSYLDQDTRVVRAGRTGRSKDDVVFYMSRE